MALLVVGAADIWTFMWSLARGMQCAQPYRGVASLWLRRGLGAAHSEERLAMALLHTSPSNHGASHHGDHVADVTLSTRPFAAASASTEELATARLAGHTLTLDFSARAAAAVNRALKRWRTLTAPAFPSANAAFAEHERARKGRLLSSMLLCIFVLQALLLPLQIITGFMLWQSALATSAYAVALVFNRRGAVYIAAALIVALADCAIFVSVWTIPDQKTDMMWVFIIPELIAVSILPAAVVFPIATCQSALIVADLALQADAPQFVMLRSQHAYYLLGAPIAAQFFVALVAYLWVRSAEYALRRADRAAEFLALRRREDERQREIEDGVRQILATHILVANGNFAARVTRLNDPLIWRVGVSLNTLIIRLTRLSRVEAALGREDRLARQLADALTAYRNGAPLRLPARSGDGLPIDAVLAALSSVVGGAESVAPSGPLRATRPGSAPMRALTGPAARVEASKEASVEASVAPTSRGQMRPTNLIHLAAPTGGRGGGVGGQGGPVTEAGWDAWLAGLPQVSGSAPAGSAPAASAPFGQEQAPTLDRRDGPLTIV